MGGDYRVERLPEVTVWRTAHLMREFLSYTLEAGAANYIVRPVGLTGIRGTAAVTLSTAPIILNPAVGVNASVGYRENVYSGGALHSAWWGSTQVSFTVSPSVSTSFTYFRQDPWSTSPLLFDTMSATNYLQASVNIAPAPLLSLAQGLTLGGSETYDFVAQTVSHRTFSMYLTLAPTVVGALGWDEVTRQLTISLSTPEVGYLSMIVELPTGRVFIGYTH
jgi:hypothetical protein